MGMTKNLIQKCIYIGAKQRQALNDVASSKGLSEASIIRLAVDWIYFNIEDVNVEIEDYKKSLIDNTHYEKYITYLTKFQNDIVKGYVRKCNITQSLIIQYTIDKFINND